MQKKIFSLVLSLFIFFISISNKTVVYANAGVTTATTTNLSGTIDSFNNASSALSSAVPLGISLTAFIKINNFVTVEGQKQAQKDFDKLSEQDRSFYKNAMNYWEINQEYYNWTGTSSVMEQNIDELKNISKPYLKKVEKFYSNVNTQIGALKQQLGLTVAGGVATSAKTLEELRQKIKSTAVSLQVDTDFINQSLEQTKKLDKTLSDKYSITSQLPTDLTKSTYNELYYVLSSNQSKLKFLYDTSYVFETISNNPSTFKLFGFDDHTYTLKSPLTFVFLDSTPFFNKDTLIYKDYYSLYNSEFSSSEYYWDPSSLFSISGDLYFSAVIFETNSSDFVSKYGPFKNTNIFFGENCYFIYYLTSMTEYLQEKSSPLGFPFSSGADARRWCKIPTSLVSSLVETPFLTLEDVRVFRRNYAGIANLQNRPIKYKINLENLQKGDLSNLEPITKEMTATFPTVNSTDLPVLDSGSLPSQGQIDSEKQKEGLVSPGTQPGTQQGVNIDLNGFLSNLIEKLKELLKSLFVPSDTFFENKFNSIKSKLDNKIGTNYFSTLGQFKDVGFFPFDDIYVNLHDRDIKIFDFSYFRNNLSNIKKITDPVFYLIFLLFCYNEVYFIIRGVYPLKNKIGDD